MARILNRAYEPLRGRVALPGDKSVSHRAALLALLADGPCRVTGWLDSADTRRSLAAVAALGAKIELEGASLLLTPPDPAAREALERSGELTIDCGNSGTTARLLSGLLAGWLAPAGPTVILTGDDSLSRRPMRRVVEPLRAMGADIDFAGVADRLPLRIRGARLRGLEHRPPTASAQVKSAILLAGLGAAGPTSIRSPRPSRDHTERLLAAMGVDLTIRRGGAAVHLDGPARPGRFDFTVPGDPSTAAFLLAAAVLVPGSRLTVAGIGLNPGRTGFLSVLQRAGVAVTTEPETAGPGTEPVGDVTVTAGEIHAFTVEAAEVPTLIDELPLLAVLATQATGTSEITGAAELRVKESDRILRTGQALRALGADVTDRQDGWIITGPTSLRGGPTNAPLLLETGRDHRVAMSLAIAALVAAGQSRLDDDGCVAVSFPEFFRTLDGLIGPSASPKD